MFDPPHETSVAGRPIANLSFAVNYAFGGREVAGYHAVNVAIHLLCALLLFGIVLGTTVAGILVGRRLRHHAETLREPFGVLQAALLGLVALILAFGLPMAVGRYDARRAAVVDTVRSLN